MFCKNCGTEISEDARFCNACGCEISPKISLEQKERKQSGDGKILLMAEPQKKWCFPLLIAGMVECLGGVYFLIYAMSIEVSVFSTAQQTQKESTILMALGFLIMGIIIEYEGMKWASMRLTICENMVYGSYGISGTKKFKLTYDEILSISGSTNFNNLVIVTKTTSYTLFHMEHVEEAVKLIHDLMDQKQNEEAS